MTREQPAFQPAILTPSGKDSSAAGFRRTMAGHAMVCGRDEQPLRSPQPTVYHNEMRQMIPTTQATEARLMGSRADMIGKLAVVVHEFSKVVLVATIFLALYQGGLLAYLVYVNKIPYAETGSYTQTGSFLLDYGVAFGIALFIASKALKYALVRQLAK